MGQMAQFNAQEERYNNNADAAAKAAAIEYKFAGRRMQEERKAAALDKQETARKAREAKATAQTQAGEAGVSGLSVDNLLGEFDSRKATFDNRVDTNLDMTTSQIQAEKQSSRARAQSRINSVRKPTPPNFFDAGVRLLGAGVKAAGTFNQYA